jgi:hypothetical protein
MANGTTRAIKDVKTGDKVIATDPTTGITAAKPVTQLHVNRDTDLTDVAVAAAPASTLAGVLFRGKGYVPGPAAVLHTTAHHPFWDATLHSWVLAGALARSHALIGPDGQVLYVVAVHTYNGAKDMRNLTVADIHTYYVVAGNTPVLVHNCGGYDLRGKDPMSIVPDNAKVRELTPVPNGAQYGLEFKWTNDDGQTVRLRIHGPDGTAPPGSNAASGDTFRVQIGGQYQDIDGNLYPRNVHNPNSPYYDPTAANATHIPWPSEYPGL